MVLPTPADVIQAGAYLDGVVHRTPVVTAPAIDRLVGAEVLFKCEHLQEIGAFKARGASWAVATLDDEHAPRGVVTHSSGNHGAALAWAAQRRGIPATVVVPKGASPLKVAAIARFGARLVECDNNQAAREAAAAAIVEQTGASLIPPFDDARIAAGQGTAALELLADHPDLELLVVPVGGGGLLAGTVLAAQTATPSPQVWGAEPADADDTARSFAAGERLANRRQPQTIADGLRTSIGAIPWGIVAKAIAGVAVVDDHAIVRAMRLAADLLGQRIEPSAAVPLAAILEGAIPTRGRRVGVILSGGNYDWSLGYPVPYQTSGSGSP